jgi:hypothetical protein
MTGIGGFAAIFGEMRRKFARKDEPQGSSAAASGWTVSSISSATRLKH